MSELPVSESFMITIFAGFAGVLAGVLACGLKSRCSRIKCCCIECDRNVIPPDQLNNVRVELPMPQQTATNH